MLGRTIGSYQILDKIGEGGMGAVYRGKHPRIGREVAIKVLLKELAKSDNIVQRFFNEARAVAAIKHPGIVEVYDVGHTDDGSPYIIMEFLRGEPLESRLRREVKLAPKITTAIMHQIAEALGAAHKQGIVHRDLKPENVFLVPDNKVATGVSVKLLDFGIAKLDEELRGGLDPTRAGAILGTPQYMSPEQCTGSTALDHRADMYALGCLMFRMLCGRPPFVEQEFGQIAIKHLSAPPPQPTQLEPAVTPELETIVLKLLEKAPDDRYQSCGQLVDALDGKTVRPATPVPVALPPGARTFVPGELPFDAKDLPINQPRAATPPPAAGEPTPARKTAYLDPNMAAGGAGPTPVPTPTPAPRSGPMPAPGPASSSPPIALIAIAAAVIVAAVVAGLLLR